MLRATKNWCCVALFPKCRDGTIVPMLSTSPPVIVDAMDVNFSNGLLCDAGMDDKNLALNRDMNDPLSTSANT